MNAPANHYLGANARCFRAVRQVTLFARRPLIWPSADFHDRYVLLLGIAKAAVVISGERGHVLRARPAPGLLHHAIVLPRGEYPRCAAGALGAERRSCAPCARRPERGAARRLADRAAASAEGTDGGLPPGRPDLFGILLKFSSYVGLVLRPVLETLRTHGAVNTRRVAYGLRRGQAVEAPRYPSVPVP